jgi:hypothetical protein
MPDQRGVFQRNRPTSVIQLVEVPARKRPFTRLAKFWSRIARRGLLTYELALYQSRRRDGQRRSVVANNDGGLCLIL